MTIELHNTLTRKKQVFKPANPKRVTFYVCGPTVYNHAHVGNFRPAVAFDLLFRVLRHHYGGEHVLYARNITDIEDKIIRAAQELNQPINAITQKYAQIYRDESAALNILPPSMEPAATDHISEIITLIDLLLQKGAAYCEQGHILFDINQFDDYGKLSNLNIDDMIAGARVEVAPYKRNAADFVLWKPSTDDEPGWDVPDQWDIKGKGRPGWHAECSAMIKKNLGTTIDIHAGGQDLRFPHHENEIAQSQCAYDAPLAHIWLHNGFLQMAGSDKMSKSLGNIVLVRDLLKKWPGEVLRWALLSAQYRQPLEWGDDLLAQSKKQLDRFYRLLSEHDDSHDNQKENNKTQIDAGVIGSLNDDLNTPGAMAALHALRDQAAAQKGNEKNHAIAILKASGQLMGFFNHQPKEWFKQDFTQSENGLNDTEIEALISERGKAKAAKDFARSDEIRDRLKENGIIIEDSATNTTWRRE